MTKSEIAIRDGWFPRLLKALKLVDVSDDGTSSHVAGSDFIGNQAAAPGYSAINSMSAMSAFPWVRACVEAISSDLTKVPLKVIKGRGKDAEPVEDHPILDLMERPSSRTPGLLLRRQVIVDLVLTGNAYLLIAGQPEPRALIRLHPERVKIIPTSDGQPGEYEFNGAGEMVRYGFDQVLHVRLPSWQQTPAMLYGTGAIEALQHDLNTDLAASKLAAESAATGLPTGIISPSEEGDRWSAQQISQLRAGFEKQLKSKSGTVILGAGVEYMQLSQTLRDMEYQNTRLLARESVLASFGVPPSRVGLPNANYATAMAQGRLYWEGLQGRAALIDNELTRLARMFPDSETVRVVHDFSEVDALQESRTERVNRVQAWWLMGVSLSEAAALEGFDQLDVAEVDDVEPEEPQEEELARWLVIDGDKAEHTAKAVGDVDPTNFPADGDDKTVSLNTSQWDVFDLKFAEKIKNNYPQIWRAGGNIKGGEQYRKLRPIALDGGSVDTRAEESAVRLREAWGARHYEDHRLAGVVAQMKWLVVGSRGEKHMKDLINDEIDKIDAESVSKWLVVNSDDSTQTRDLDTEEGRATVWRSFIKRVHGPAERKMALTMRRYLRAQAARISKRLKKELGTKGITKAIDDKTLDRILDEAYEREQLLALFRPLYRKSLKDAFAEAARSVGSDVLIDADELERQALSQIKAMQDKVLDTTAQAVRDTLNTGLEQQLTLPQMQQSIVQASGFSPSRALMIARTETTKLANTAAVDAYRKVEESGLRVDKQWLSARDGKVRPEHAALDGQTVPTGDVFKSNGATANAPGAFGSAALDINCRCTVIGKVID